MRDSNYIVKFGWMTNRLGLRGSKLEVFALIYGFSQDGASCFSGTYNYIADMCGISLRSAKYVIKQLCEMGFIEKIETEQRQNTYKICMEKIDSMNSQNDGAKIAPSTDQGCKNCTVEGAKTAPSYNNIYNNNIYNTNNTNSAEDKTSAQPVILLPLNTKNEYPVTASAVNEFAELYPAVDVMQQLRAMRAWLLANPKRRKTKSGIMKFINSWLSREQNKGGVYVPPKAPSVPAQQVQDEDFERWNKQWNIT